MIVEVGPNSLRSSLGLLGEIPWDCWQLITKLRSLVCGKELRGLTITIHPRCTWSLAEVEIDKERELFLDSECENRDPYFTVCG